MPQRPIVARIAALPLGHKLIAVCVSLAVTFAFLLSILLLPAQQYTGSALLSFDGASVAGAGDQGSQNDQGQTAALAQSILSDDALKTLCWQLNLIPENPTGAEVEQFRSGLTLAQVSPSQLRVSWHGLDRSQVVSAANAVAVLLASWVPEGGAHQASDSSLPPPQPGAARPRVAGELPGLEAVLRQHQQHQFKLAAIDQSLADLAEEARKLDEKMKQSGAERQRLASARQPLITQLAAEKKKLEGLRARYTDEYPDVEAERERIAELETRLDAMPAPASPQDNDQAVLNTISKQRNDLISDRVLLVHQLQQDAWLEKGLGFHGPQRSASAATLKQGSAGQSAGTQIPFPTSAEQARPFTVVESAADAEPMDRRYSMLRRGGAIAGPICGLLYLLLAAWWFRAVSDFEMLAKVLPAGVSYLGAIPEMNRWRHNL